MNKTPKTAFHKWRLDCGLTQQSAAKVLGISKGQIEFYDAGRHRGTGNRVGPTLAERTLMALIAAKVTVQPWPSELTPDQ